MTKTKIAIKNNCSCEKPCSCHAYELIHNMLYPQQQKKSKQDEIIKTSDYDINNQNEFPTLK